MEQIRKDNNHVYEFVEDLNIVTCDPKIGMTSSALYDAYSKWAIEEGYIITNRYGEVTKYSHPHDQYDRVLTSKKQLTSKLKEIFPRLEQVRNMTKRTFNLTTFETS